MYATWLDYNVITNMGANVEVLIASREMIHVNWMNGPGYSNRKDFASLWYNHSGMLLELGDDPNGGWYARDAYGARPTLYQE